MSAKKVTQPPTEEKRETAPLTLSDLTISRPRYSTANQREEMQSFSGAQIALLLIANQYEGNLANITDKGCIADEIRGVSQCLEALSVEDPVAIIFILG